MNDKQLHKIIIESMDKVLNENEENEVFGKNHGIRGAIQSAANGGKMWNGFKNGVNNYYTAKKRANNIQSIRNNGQQNNQSSQQIQPVQYSEPQQQYNQNQVQQQNNQNQQQEQYIQPEVSYKLINALSYLRQLIQNNNSQQAMIEVGQMMNYIKVLNGETNVEESKKKNKKTIK